MEDQIQQVMITLTLIISEWCLEKWLSSITVIIGCHYILVCFFLTSFWHKQKIPDNLLKPPNKTLNVFDNFELHLKSNETIYDNILFYRNNFPAQQQFFCKSRPFELLPFCRTDPGASSESQAVGEHLLHKIILQAYSWYGFIKILFISHVSSKPFPFFLFCVCFKSEKAF